MVQTETQHRSTAEALSFTTAYAGLGLLAAALAIGPFNVLRRKANPVSADIRRDVGIWAAGYGIAHTITGLNVHMRGHMIRYFVHGSGTLDTATRVFIAANWSGLIAVLLLVALMAISNDIALRALGTRRWKLIQQSTYVIAVAVVIHGGLYQILEKRKWLPALIFSVLAVSGLIFQSAGMRARRRLRKLDGSSVSAGR